MDQKNNFASARPRLSDFTSGISAPFRSLSLVSKTKAFWPYFIVPFILNLALLSAAFYVGYAFLLPVIHGLLPQGGAWYYRLIHWIVSPLLTLFLILATALLYSITGSILTAPFNDFISARIEESMTGVKGNEPFSFFRFIADIARIALNVVRLLVLIVVFHLLILFCNLIPLAGSALYGFLSFSAMCFFLGFQFFDFPLDRRRMAFGAKLSLMWRFKLLTIGLGLGFFIISLVPLVGFLGLNLGAAGATMLFVERIYPPEQAR